MPISQQDADALTQTRCAYLSTRKTRILRTYCNLENGDGAIAMDHGDKTGARIIWFFRARAKYKTFGSHNIESHHDILDLAGHLAQFKADLKAKKTAAHDLEVGDILVSVWGVTMQRADFYRVVAVPTPRKVRMAPIPQILINGDWMSGRVVPDTEAAPDMERAVPDTVFVEMRNGTAHVKTSSRITHITRWDGTPVSIYSD